MVSIRVVSYNVRSLRDDRSALVGVIRDLRPDVLCLQEAPRWLAWRGKLAAFARDTDLLYVAGGGTTGGTAMLTSVRVDVRASAEHRLPHTRGMVRRGVVITDLAVAGQEFVAASLHLGLDATERGRHLTVIQGLLAAHDAASVIVAGDINETDRSATWSRLAASYTDVGASDPTPTFSTGNPRRRIDGVFVRGAVDVAAYQVPDTPAVRAASDHRPVVVDLELTG